MRWHDVDYGGDKLRKATTSELIRGTYRK